MTVPPSLGEWLSWAAAILSLASFTRKTMIPLRWLAAGANVAYLGYGLLLAAPASVLLHAIELPINLWRLRQMKRLIADVARAEKGEISADWLVPYAVRSERAAGDVLMRKGDAADHVVYLLSGRVRVVELGEVCDAGQLFGEIGVFADAPVRTQSLACETDCVLLTIDVASLREICFQNPTFGFHFARLINRRLSADVARLQAEVAALRRDAGAVRPA